MLSLLDTNPDLLCADEELVASPSDIEFAQTLFGESVQPALFEAEPTSDNIPVDSNGCVGISTNLKSLKHLIEKEKTLQGHAFFWDLDGTFSDSVGVHKDACKLLHKIAEKRGMQVILTHALSLADQDIATFRTENLFNDVAIMERMPRRWPWDAVTKLPSKQKIHAYFRNRPPAPLIDHEEGESFHAAFIDSFLIAIDHKNIKKYLKDTKEPVDMRSLTFASKGETAWSFIKYFNGLLGQDEQNKKIKAAFLIDDLRPNAFQFYNFLHHKNMPCGALQSLHATPLPSLEGYVPSLFLSSLPKF